MYMFKYQTSSKTDPRQFKGTVSPVEGVQGGNALLFILYIHDCILRHEKFHMSPSLNTIIRIHIREENQQLLSVVHREQDTHCRLCSPCFG